MQHRSKTIKLFNKYLLHFDSSFLQSWSKSSI